MQDRPGPMLDYYSGLHLNGLVIVTQDLASGATKHGRPNNELLNYMLDEVKVEGIIARQGG
ncbi:hypothetical protein QFC21_005783 [Naganishia friedmannii]|uniref:Uncharacterized protein n=1 Tax=Naganishia friedmannii TaxID=89922 RepID=A0ACC2V6M1_9TREE|nr:hypothetical protein QFC21_005783 [Naganishia friedmannii]